MELQVGVKILLKNQAGKYLLLKRSQKKYPKIKDAWDVVGGRIKNHEALLKGLRREIKEETSWALEFKKPPRLLAVQDILRPPKLHIVRLTYLAEVEIGKKLKLSVEHEAYKWFSLNELKKLKDLDEYIKELLIANKI